MKTDYYKILGVDQNCDEKAIKSAFRRLAMKYHPDKNPGDKEAEKKFKELGEAYEILKDPQKRAAYDRYGHDAFSHGGGGGFSAHAGFGSFSDIFSEMFGDFMGGGNPFDNASPKQNIGADLRYNMSISLQQAYTGFDTEISIKAPTSCSECKGTGAAKDSKIEKCSYCKGRGMQRVQQGFFVIEKPCSHCHGDGQVIINPCKNCGGAGRVQKKRIIKINIPKGVSDGTRLRLTGEGEAGLKGGKNGDLYVFITVKPHELFARSGSDLHCIVPITMTKAALGGAIEISLLSGKKQQVKIPAGIQNGKKLCLRGEGMPNLQRPGCGDLFIQLNVETPQNLSAKQIELLQQFEAMAESKNSPNSSGFFKTMCNFFKHL